jgi:hypothetical protein
VPDANVSDQINPQTPGWVVERLQRDAKLVFPIAVALRCVARFEEGKRVTGRQADNQCSSGGW